MENQALERIAAPSLPEARYVQRGKGTVRVTPFNGQGSASEIRAEFKAAGFKGNELTERVNAVLTGARSMAEVLAAAWLQSRIAAGEVPSCGEESKSGSVLRLVKIAEPKPAKAGKSVDEMTDEELAEILAKRKAAKN